MSLFLTVILAGSLASAQEPAAGAKPGPPNQAAAGQEGAQPNLMTLPSGKITVMGGTVDRVDLINDQFTLKIFGAKPVKILFDERTRIYRDGKKTTVAELRPNSRASVETMLDGTTVFARAIHMLSKAPQGETQGQVVSFDPTSRLLTVAEVLSREPIKLMVPAGTTFVRQGQAASASGTAGAGDLVKGTLIAATFTADNKGQGVASKIAILATPGSQITFAGDVTYLSLRAKEMAVLDAEDQQSYKLSFDPAKFPEARDLHEGSHVKVTAEFDGTRYVARSITLR
jgi:hypothetical protein